MTPRETILVALHARLSALAARVGVTFRHHDAGEDAYACARIALAAARTEDPDFLATEVAEAVNHAANVHALAAALAADTQFGPAPAPTSRIADFIREATAALSDA